MKANLPLLFAALIAGAVLTTLATTTHSRTTFEYLVVTGYPTDEAGWEGKLLDPKLAAAGNDGWEAVSWTQDSDGSPYFHVLLKRQKER